MTWDSNLCMVNRSFLTFKLSRRVLRPNQALIQWVLRPFPWGVKQASHDTEHSSPSSTEITNERQCTSTPSLYVQGQLSLSLCNLTIQQCILLSHINTINKHNPYFLKIQFHTILQLCLSPEGSLIASGFQLKLSAHLSFSHLFLFVYLNITLLLQQN